MQDLIFVAVSVAFFVVSIGYVHFCEPLEVRSEVEENDMSLEAIIMLVISALTIVYLFYALLRPEKF
jgi:K+-transporting ATPase KdpF subunit